MQIRPGCLLFYDQSFYSYTGAPNPFRKTDDKLPTHKVYTGKMNERSKSRLRFSINLLVEQAKWKEVLNPKTDTYYKFKVNFITLTLSGKQRQVSDKEIKSKMLAPWIRNMKNVYKLRSYVWRAERQKNGNIHFHFTTDTYIPYDAIRDSWNHQQAKYHFIKEFRNRNSTEFPNSTDVHSIRNIENLASYMVKYMCKDEQGLESIEGKVWDCSTNLKTKERVFFEMGSKEFFYFSKLAKIYNDQSYFGEHCSVIPLSRKEMRQHLSTDIMKKYEDWIESVYQSAGPLIVNHT